jgi:Bacteriophage HK97-gp10, putative tail-component
MTSGRSTYKEIFKKVKLETPKKIDKALQDTAVEVIGKMIDRTPVDTGAAKYHWFIRALPNEKFDKKRVDPSGAQPKARAKRDVKVLFKIGLECWLVNSAPYMIFLEQGSSTQAPQGVVAITMQEVAPIFKKHIKTAISKPI